MNWTDVSAILGWVGVFGDVWSGLAALGTIGGVVLGVTLRFTAWGKKIWAGFCAACLRPVRAMLSLWANWKSAWRFWRALPSQIAELSDREKRTAQRGAYVEDALFHALHMLNDTLDWGRRIEKVLGNKDATFGGTGGRAGAEIVASWLNPKDDRHPGGDDNWEGLRQRFRERFQLAKRNPNSMSTLHDNRPSPVPPVYADGVTVVHVGDWLRFVGEADKPWMVTLMQAPPSSQGASDWRIEMSGYIQQLNFIGDRLEKREVKTMFTGKQVNGNVVLLERGQRGFQSAMTLG